MMATYFVKENLPGLPAGRVERFLVTRAGMWGKALELYDEKKHGHALRKQEREDAERRQATKDLLTLERTDPDAYHAHERERRLALMRADVEEHKARLKERARRDELSEQ